LTTADDFFRPWESVIESWPDALAKIEAVTVSATTSRELAWRGVAKAHYALHSSLYRRFVASRATTPDEADLVRFEQEILSRARKRWRFDNLGALETFAHLQHYGGPTRLLDVSFNPLVALWFAVELKHDKQGVALPDDDGRLFIFDVTGRQIDLDEKWGTRPLPWQTSPPKDWQRSMPIVWRPPSYNERIPAQNSAFLIGGVPQVYAGGNTKYRKAPGDGTSGGTWNIQEVREATSVTLQMATSTRQARSGGVPTFTLRVKASAKEEIRDMLEDRYGLTAASIYPDLYALARYGGDGIPL
jgi:hypothetical protein